MLCAVAGITVADQAVLNCVAIMLFEFVIPLHRTGPLDETLSLAKRLMVLNVLCDSVIVSL